MSLSLLLIQYPICFARLSCIISDVGSKLLFNYCFVEYYFKYCLKLHAVFFCTSHPNVDPSVYLESKLCNHIVGLKWLTYLVLTLRNHSFRKYRSFFFDKLFAESLINIGIYIY